MKRYFFPGLIGALLLVLGARAAAQDEDQTLRLAIGDPQFKDRTLEIQAGQIVSSALGRSVSWEFMAEDLARVKFIYIGETHNSLPNHDLQFRILQALSQKDANLALGLEMFPSASQEVLNKWSLGLLTEEEFLREARWYVVWNYHWGFYRRIFGLAKERSIPLRALNVDRDIITKVRMKGWEGLSDEEKALVPKPDLSNQDHKALIKAVFSAEELPPQMKGAGLEVVFEGLYRAQSAWDEVMAANTLLASAQGKRRVVVLAGSGHLLYSLGINRRVYEKNRLPFRTVVCVTVPKDRASLTVSRTLADYICGLSEEERPAYPSLGLRLRTVAGLSNLVIESKPVEGAAVGQDFEKGDIILAVNGKTYTDINELRLDLAIFTWGQEVKFKLLRAGEVREVTLRIIPPPPKAGPAGRPKEDQAGLE
ncbi:MAG TPA: ChaN family lipoprotein [Acidobacteriota bacterium]